MNFHWPFRKPAPPKPVRPPINEAWKPGDMAECIADGWRNAPVRAPTLGTRAMVSDVVEAIYRDGRLGWGLMLVGFPSGDHAWDAKNFRKIVLIENGADRKVGERVSA